MSEEKPNILIVDQDRFSSLIVKMLAGRYESLTASDGPAAIDSLRERPPDVLVAEEGVGGIRLAELVGMSDKYSHIPVILTSAKPSPETIIKSRNAGISTFLAKPFRPSELITRIDSAIEELNSGKNGEVEDDEVDEETKKENSQSLKDRVKQIDGLPSFPATHAEIMQLAKSDDASSEDLAEKIQLDPSFLAQVLKLVNSSYYGFRKKTSSLKLAVTLIGMEEVGNLVMAAQVFERLGNYDGGAGLDLKQFWRHSVGTAFIARAVAKKLQTEVEAAFLGGLLHDLGKVVLDRYFSDYYGAVFDRIGKGEIGIRDAERDVLGVDHEEIGGQLASAWKFSDNYSSCILHHHEPDQSARFTRLVRVIHIADCLCRQLEYGSGGDEIVPEIDADVMDSFSMGERGVSILTETAKVDLDDADSFLSALN
jgi:putative nucleotidyltransferase with HDIG domain